MSKYKDVEYILNTIFNGENGFSEDQAISIYLEAIDHNQEAYKKELNNIFHDPQIKWKDMLLTPDYEAYDADSEKEAKLVATRWLYDPVFKK